MIPPAAGIGIIEDVKLPIAALESQIQSIARPKYADSGFTPRIWIVPLPISAKRNRFGRLPLCSRLRGSKLDGVWNVLSYYFSAAHEIVCPVSLITKSAPRSDGNNRQLPKHGTSITQKINLTAISG